MTDHTQAIASVFSQFGIDATIVNIVQGPSVVRYEATLGRGVKVDKVEGLQKEIAYATAAQSVRILAPIPGKTAIGIELPRDDREIVSQSLIMGNHVLTVGIGKDVEGNMVTANLNEMPHLLVAGQTGSGKSSFINSMLCTLLETHPDEVKLLLIDPKMVELTPYEGVAHLLRPVITEVDEAVAALKDLCAEMDSRYTAMKSAGQRTVEGMGFPYIICVIDELADLILQSKGVEKPIVRLAQKARAAGIHLVIATQRPTVDVVTGLIKANVPSRLAFAVTSGIDSKVVLDETGAEQLLGKGDGLFRAAGMREPVRIQGVLVTDDEIKKSVQAATATAAVEQMVDEMTLQVDQLQYVDFFDQVIEKAEASVRRVENYFHRLEGRKGFFNKGGRMEVFTQAPKELGEAGASLAEIAQALRFIKSNVVVTV